MFSTTGESVIYIAFGVVGSFIVAVSSVMGLFFNCSHYDESLVKLEE